MQHTNSHIGHHGRNGHISQMAPGEVTQDLLHKHGEWTPGFKRLMVALGAVFLVGFIAFLIKAATSFGNRAEWGYYAATFAFIFTVAQSAPMMAVAPRLAKAHWSRPVHRVAEAFALVGVFNLIFFIPLLFLLPSANGRFSLWFVDGYRQGFPPAAPHVWIILAMVFLVACGLALLYVSSKPDLAAVRDHSTGRRQRFYTFLAQGWRGDKKQWFTLSHRIGILGAFYFMMLIFTHFLISVDFSMALVPGWKDSIYPMYHALNGLQSAVAITLIAMFLLRRFGGMEKYLGVDQFWASAKILLALSLLWAYFWFSGFHIYWYGRSPAEQNVLRYIMFESYRAPWVISFILCFVVPLTFLIWNRIRKSILGPTLIGSSVVIGTFFSRISAYVAGFAIEDPSLHALGQVPPAVLPDVWDILIILGALAGAALTYTIAIKIFPTTSIWEMKSFFLMRRFKKYKRTEVMVVAKPE